MSRKVYGKTVLSVKCDNTELKSIVNDELNSLCELFTFKQLYSNVLSVLNHRKLLNTEPDTEYSEIDLDGKATDFIHFFVWEKIWEHKIVIDLIQNEYVPNRGIKLRKIM